MDLLTKGALPNSGTAPAPKAARMRNESGRAYCRLVFYDAIMRVVVRTATNTDETPKLP